MRDNMRERDGARDGVRSAKANQRKSLRQKKRRRRKLLLFSVEIFMLLLLVVAVKAWDKFSDLYQIIEIESEFENESEAGINSEIETEIREVLEGYTNIALFGLDNRSAGNYNKGRSDAIMIASINNVTKEVKLVSVYRDTYLSIGNGKYNKANAAYSAGGAKQAVQMLNSCLDLDITEYVCVDWAALIEAIDALGGVEIDVTSQEVGYINDYVDEMARVLGADGEHVTRAGKQVLNGTQATGYARIRYTAGDDFKRSSRQRIVLEAMLNKAKNADLGKLIEICGLVFDDISTTLTMDEIWNLAKDVMNYDISSTSGFPFKMTCKTLASCGSTVIPIDLAANVSQLHHYLFATEDYTPTFSVQAVSDTIMDKTGVYEDEIPVNTDSYNNTAGQDGTVFD